MDAYRPPHSTPWFNTHFLEFVSSLCSSYKLVVLLGDFNYWAGSEANTAPARTFMEGLESLGLIQLVLGPTHCKGHTLNPIWAFPDSVVVSRVEPCVWLDHHFIFSSVENAQKEVFAVLKELTHAKSSSTSIPASQVRYNFIQDFFISKIQDIKRDNSISQKTLASPAAPALDPELSIPGSVTHVLSQFPLLDLPLPSKYVSLVSSGSLTDPCPPTIFKALLPAIVHPLLSLLNFSITSGVVPDRFKAATVVPLLKKPGADVEVPKNYRPTSLLPFFTKVLEKHITQSVLQQT